MTLKDFRASASALPATERMPALFVGHGDPMNAIEDNPFSRTWTRIGRELPKPRAILSVSAHWFIREALVNVSAQPRTIHDFYGFPQELYDQRYPCPGAPAAAEEARRAAKDVPIGLDTEWGLDHGTWSVLKRLYPDADVPTFQLSLDYTKPSRFHYELGQALAPLRRKGVLIMGSGNIVHNLGMVDPAADRPFDWAAEFDAVSRRLIEDGDHDALVAYEKLGHAAELSIPTPDHYWPMLYALGLQEKDETPSFFNEGVVYGSVSMLGFRLS